MTRREAGGAAALYDERYAEIYRALYVLHPQWQAKHACNLRLLRSLLRPGARWLDTCCGQAWHFREIDGVHKTGIDASAAQLRRARRDDPWATFLEADVLTCDLGGATFDLVTNFWGAYAYLDDLAGIATLVHRTISWTAPGGALYLEVLTPATLAAFNATAFASSSASAVELRSEDAVTWRYRDPGGCHHLTSPPVAFFEALLRPWFARVEVREVVATMAQLVATGRSEQRAVDGDGRRRAAEPDADVR